MVVGAVVSVDIQYHLQLGQLSNLLELFSIEGLQHIQVANQEVVLDREELSRLLILGEGLVKNTSDTVE